MVNLPPMGTFTSHHTNPRSSANPSPPSSSRVSPDTIDL